MIPHVEDEPRLIEAEVAVASPTAPSKAPWPVMTYSWAPQKGVRSYNIRFYKGDVMVRGAEVTEPTYAIALPPGKYQWIVWPTNESKAIVNSTVTIP